MPLDAPPRTTLNIYFPRLNGSNDMLPIGWGSDSQCRSMTEDIKKFKAWAQSLKILLRAALSNVTHDRYCATGLAGLLLLLFHVSLNITLPLIAAILVMTYALDYYNQHCIEIICTDMEHQYAQSNTVINFPKDEFYYSLLEAEISSLIEANESLDPFEKKQIIQSIEQQRGQNIPLDAVHLFHHYFRDNRSFNQCFRESHSTRIGRIKQLCKENTTKGNHKIIDKIISAAESNAYCQYNNMRHHDEWLVQNLREKLWFVEFMADPVYH